ncbi:DNA repair protein SWI5 homolog [Dasypus novemcinctus]|uniref:DNA repair protein SWI5 homolog n=1 Tax=Dasypus novemcinctus TaxID=9361 RepID=UPI002660599F|nr:DNA repair protein SWI5 homolog [Dasypus novemcinctus]
MQYRPAYGSWKPLGLCPIVQRPLQAENLRDDHRNRKGMNTQGVWVGRSKAGPAAIMIVTTSQPGLFKSSRGNFRSPWPSPNSGQVDGASEESLQLDIQKLKEKRDLLDKEISQLISEGYNVDELENHISQLHEYNDIKDVGQMLLGKLAVIRGVTTKELYPEFDLDMND